MFILLILLADIGRKPTSPVHGSRQRLHAGVRYTPGSEMDLVSLNMAAPVRSVMSGSIDNPKTLNCSGVYIYNYNRFTIIAVSVLFEAEQNDITISNDWLPSSYPLYLFTFWICGDLVNGEGAQLYVSCCVWK